MSFRYKLVILSLCLALAPMLGIRLMDAWLAFQTSEELARRGGQALTVQAEREIQLLVDRYTQLIEQVSGQIELGLNLQARQVEAALARPAEPDQVQSLAQSLGRAWWRDDFSAQARAAQALTTSPLHFRRSPEGGRQPLDISLKAQLLHAPPGDLDPARLRAAASLAGLTPIYQNLHRRLSSLVLWHLTCLENGVLGVFPGMAEVPAGYDPRQEAWYRRTLEADGPVWLGPFPDNLSGQLAILLALPVRSPQGRAVGVTAMIMSVSLALEQSGLPARLPPGSLATVVYAEPRPDGRGLGLRVAARVRAQASAGDAAPPAAPLAASDAAALENAWLEVEDEQVEREVLADLAARRSNSRRIPYAGQDCLWTYGSPDGGTMLALIIPYERILGPVQEQVDMVRDIMREQAMTTGYLLLGVALLVALVAVGFARTITRPVTALAEAAGRLAAGDLAARVEIASRDEFGQVAAVFNQVGPTVRENQRVRESLARAEELLLREKNRLQGEKLRGLMNLAQSVAHQVRNPVLAIGGFARRLDAQLAQAKLDSPYPGIILDQAARLERVVAATSGLASLPQARLAPTSLAAAMEPARRQAEQRASALGKAIVWQGACPPRLVLADPELLAKALEQVLLNCLDFAPGPLVTIRLGQGEDPPWSLLEIGDDGPGVAPGDLAYVFDPFFTSKADGAGMGLTLARQIVLELEGDLVMASPGPLGGAQVTFRLKPAPAEAGAA